MACTPQITPTEKQEMPTKTPSPIEIKYSYSYSQHTRPGTKEPSRNDRDYKKVDLSLMSDHSCILTERRGRLSIIQNDTYYGKWNQKDQQTLELAIDSVLHYGETLQPKETFHATPRVYRLTIDKYKLLYKNEMWLRANGVDYIGK